MVHTFIYDGDPQRDFLAGIGMRMQVDLRDDPHNRHIWLAGDNADLWHEPAQLLAPHLFDKRASDHPQRVAQMRGEMVTAPQGPQQTPIWKSFTLVQESCDHFCIRKSCGRDHKAITAHHGHRATGMAALTGAQGGLAVTLNDCWQAYPRSLEVAAVGATQDDDASLTVWFWSPDAPAADLRHYDASVYTALYEAPFTYTPDRSRWDSGPIDPSVQSARGIARTSELTWHLLPQAPDPDELSRLAKAHVDGPVMVCAPQVYAASGTLGCWSLPSEGDDRARMLEVGQEKLLDFVLTQREARRWYGFWDNGDVVHSYDPHRQQWRYDEGGYAWNNGECVPDLWLWYSFLRSGRGDVFAFARAMTEHLRDVDTYHQGPHAGLGTRHNVTHWGCACKEPRISMAASRRILYYLTGGDERTGDVLDATCDAWPQTPTAMPLSPTWSSLGWNWLTQWERTGSTQHRDKLRRGMNDLLARKAPFMDEVMLVLDPATGGLSTPEPRQAYNHVMLLPFGGPELWFELADLFDDAPWRQALADYGRLWSLPGPKRQQHVPDGTAASAQIDHAVFSARMLAWAGVHTQDQALTDQALAILTSWCFDPQRITSVITAAPTGYTLPHPVTHQLTNYVQWGLNVIECLSLSRRLRGK